MFNKKAKDKKPIDNSVSLDIAAKEQKNDNGYEKLLSAIEKILQKSAETEEKLTSRIQELNDKIDALSNSDNHVNTQNFDEVKADGSAASLNEIVIQLDRLFDDIKVILGDTETNVVKSIEHTALSLNEFKENFALKQAGDDTKFESIENKVDKLALDVDNLSLQNSVTADIAGKNAESISELAHAVEDLTLSISQINTKLDTVITSNIRISEDIAKLQDQVFKMGMVSVTENGDERFDSYHNLILDEVCALRKNADALAAKFEDCKSVASEEKIDKISAATENILSGLDDVMAKIAMSELSAEQPDIKEAEVSRGNLSKSLDELKRELSQLAEDISARK